MRGKPIELVEIEDLQQLIADGVTEDRQLELKRDIPVSPEEQKSQARSYPSNIPADRSWISNKAIMPFGRDALAEEVVAFANASGGTLILGIDETDEAPPRAKCLNALPDVVGLERRLRDALADCIEPRLPYVAVRGVVTEGDGGGVILIEIGASSSGPHWVKKTRKPTIRREDRCDTLTMPEVHDMVLRNSRSMSAVVSQTEAVRKEFVEWFRYHLGDKSAQQIAILHLETRVEEWLSSIGHAALGAQAVLVPHYDLAIPRLERIDGLLPPSDAIGIQTHNGIRKTHYIEAYLYALSYQQKMLGGVMAIQDGGFRKSIKVYRDGKIIVSFFQHRETRSCTCSADLIVALAGFVLGLFDRLRRLSSYPSAPANLSIDICTRGHVGVGDYEGINLHGIYGRLPEHLEFPSYTIGESGDITLALQEVASDLMNAGGMAASHLPKVVWSDPH
ncbi:ATP-binding protein [Methylobacterium sp. Leaf108]|uniref:AlbA family DNA-binding domain-containing protein n=1 Tax=Methylobacterium sp. Leaf108 TaxID=1736256 RepID=UPI0009E70421|nr:ATP-binding protein [Methylobacterium sp. Leaf108]